MNGASLRLFFALWPDPAASAALDRWLAGLRRDTRARWLSPGQLHLTLAFIGDVALARLPEVMAIGQTLRAPPFALRLDRLEAWRRAGVLCLTPTSAPAGLVELSQGLHRLLREAGFAVEERPFRAHLTLARGLRHLPPALAAATLSVDWWVETYCLVASRRADTGSSYDILRSWPLAAAAPGNPDCGSSSGD